MTPAKTETFFSQEQAYARLRQIGAQYKPEKSTQARHVYWIGKTKAWAQVSYRGGQFVVDYFSACPC